MQRLRRRLETGESAFFEHHNWWADCITLSDGCLGVICSFTDFSSVELARSEERFRAFVTASANVVYQMSADWSEMRHLRGRNFIIDTDGPTESWIDKHIHPSDRALVVERIQHAIRTRSLFELEHRVIRVDGSLGRTFSRAIPILDSQGVIVE